jgi:tetratricopeptide (TPR) repeat protein
MQGCKNKLHESDQTLCTFLGNRLQSEDRRLALNLMRENRKAVSGRKRIGFAQGGVLSISLCLFLHASSSVAEIANELEPEYALAVLDYNDQKYDSALRILNRLQEKAPKSAEFLELKAITHKALKDDKGAALTYQRLIQLKRSAGVDKKESAPYAYELGVIRYNEGNWKEAQQYLSYSARHGFNVALSRFYLGLSQIQLQSWARAEFNLREVLKADIEEIKPAAHYYRAQASFKLNRPAVGFSELMQSKKSADRFIESEEASDSTKAIAAQVKAAAESTLTPFDRAQTFGNFSLMTGYDSNALLVPMESISPNSASGKSTARSTVSAGFGYASSPMKTIQAVPSIRFNFNKNFNGASSASEFADTTASLFLTKDAMAPFAYGLKTEGGLVFQNQDDASGSKKYRFYNSAVVLAPYVKLEPSNRLMVNLELGLRLQGFGGEDRIAESFRRSGDGAVFKATLQDRKPRTYLNPVYVFRFETNSTEGNEYASRFVSVQWINTMKLSSFDLAQVITIERTNYHRSSNRRKDTLLLASLLATKKIGPRWALMFSGDFTRNDSTEAATFTYDRFTANAGIGYSF